MLDIGNLIGTLLLYRDKISFDDLNVFIRRNKMLDKDCEITGKPLESISYWGDFFKIDNDGFIVKNTSNLELMEFLFYDSLDEASKKDIDKIVKKL